MEGCSLQLFNIAKELPMTVLRQRMTEDMQVRNFSPHTQASYLQQVSLFARHFAKSPDVLAPEHIRTYQIYLTNERKLAAGSIQSHVRVDTVNRRDQQTCDASQAHRYAPCQSDSHRHVDSQCRRGELVLCGRA